MLLPSLADWKWLLADLLATLIEFRPIDFATRTIKRVYQ
jgi:hypothetical protein